jgi:hypothetical protein
MITNTSTMIICALTCAILLAEIQTPAFAAPDAGGYILIATKRYNQSSFAITQRFSTASNCESAKRWWIKTHVEGEAECFQE